jgi:membrane protein required for colicin V production
VDTLDIICICVVGFTVIRGAFRGLVREVMGVVAVVGALIVAGLLYKHMSGTFAGVLLDSSVRDGTAYALTFGVVAVGFALAAWFLDSLIKSAPNLGPLNQAGGLVFGGLKGVLLVAVILLCLRWFPNAGDALDDSALASVFEPLVNTMAHQVDQVVEEKLPEVVAPLTD